MKNSIVILCKISILDFLDIVFEEIDIICTISIILYASW